MERSDQGAVGITSVPITTPGAILACACACAGNSVVVTRLASWGSGRCALAEDSSGLGPAVAICAAAKR